MRNDFAAGEATSMPVMSERRVSLLGALFVVIGPMSMALYTPAMPEIVDAFGTTQSLVKMTLALYFAGFAFAQLIVGPLSDALGRRPVMLMFMTLYVASSLLAVWAPGIEVLLVARLLQGIGASAGVAISRAVVRDLFEHEQSVRIMNLVGIILAIGPAIAPTIGCITMELAGWNAIFLIMALLGIIVLLAVILAMKETVEPDIGRLRPGALVRTYGLLLTNFHFMTTSLVLGFTVGAIYAQSTFLPFILMDNVGLTPAQFGLSMIVQSGAFFAGSLGVRFLMASFPSERLIVPGLVFVLAGGMAQSILLFTQPTLASVMVPVGIYSIGFAFVMPAITTLGLAPFRDMAGSASSLMGFIQMSTGLVMASIGALIGNPVVAMGILLPLMAFAACVSYFLFRRWHAGPLQG